MINSDRVGFWINEDGEVGKPDPYNLYRYVHNNPTDFTDPSGLAEKLEHEGKFNWTYENEEKKKVTVEVTVIVKSGVEFDDRPDWIQLREAKNGAVQGDFHWVQFVYTIRKKGKTIVPGGRLQLADTPPRYTTYADKEEGYTGDAQIVDTHLNADGKLSIYYDQAGGADATRKPARKYDRLGGLSIFDRPDVTKISEPELKATDFSEIRSIHDAYLVEKGVVYYHVHWERVGTYDTKEEEWTPRYEKVKGEVVKDGKLPKTLFNKNGKLRLGYKSVDRKTNTFSDPVEASFPE